MVQNPFLTIPNDQHDTVEGKPIVLFWFYPLLAKNMLGTTSIESIGRLFDVQHPYEFRSPRILQGYSKDTPKILQDPSSKDTPRILQDPNGSKLQGHCEDPLVGLQERPQVSRAP